MLLKNLELKIISVVLALFLWFIVVTSDYQESTFDVPIVLENLNKGLIAVYDANIIRVTLKGPSYILKTISFNDIKIIIDASRLNYGENRYAISFNDVYAPKGVEIIKIEPKFINITIDKLVEKKVKVVPVFIGSARVGFKLKKITIYPKFVMVKGAKKSIEKINSLETLPIDITGKFKELTYNIAVKKEPGIMEIKPPYVEVNIEFGEDIATKSVVWPVTVKNDTKFKIKLLNSNVNVKLKGRKDYLLDENLKENLKLYVDTEGIDKPGRYLRKVKYEPISGLKILKITPDKVRVEVKE